MPFISFTYIGPSLSLDTCCYFCRFSTCAAGAIIFYIFPRTFRAASCESCLWRAAQRSLVMGCCSICIPISRCQNDSTLSPITQLPSPSARLFGHSMKDIPSASHPLPLHRWPQYFNCYAGAQRECTNVGGIKNN